MTSPKFSVLLPTRNRLDLLRGAIETVRRQTYGDWEIIVSDNYSEENVEEYIKELNDTRIIYIRSNHFLPVTENWNLALNASSGQYIIMLGDDDGLTPRYFDNILDAMLKLNDPDFIYHGAYHFLLPNTLPDVPEGRLIDMSLHYECLQNAPEPRLMPLEEARAAARHSLEMRGVFGFNMQYFLFSRRFLDKMKHLGPFFQGPFPDFYAANISMLLADKIGIVAKPLVIIGITPKSYGYFHFNKREEGGMSFLQGDSGLTKDATLALQSELLPGTNMLTSWLISVALITRNLPERTDIKLGIKAYRRFQIMYNLQQNALGHAASASLRKLWALLTWQERIFGLLLSAWLLPLPLISAKKRQRWFTRPNRIFWQFPKARSAPPSLVDGKYQSMVEVYTDLSGQQHQ